MVSGQNSKAAKQINLDDSLEEIPEKKPAKARWVPQSNVNDSEIEATLDYGEPSTPGRRKKKKKKRSSDH